MRGWIWKDSIINVRHLFDRDTCAGEMRWPLDGLMQGCVGCNCIGFGDCLVLMQFTMLKTQLQAGHSFDCLKCVMSTSQRMVSVADLLRIVRCDGLACGPERECRTGGPMQHHNPEDILVCCLLAGIGVQS